MDFETPKSFCDDHAEVRPCKACAELADAFEAVPVHEPLLPVVIGFNTKHHDIKQELIHRISDLINSDPKIVSYGGREAYGAFEESLSLRSGDISIDLTVRTPK